MPKKKKFQVKVNVSLPTELAEWLEDMVNKGVFSSFSHGIRRCVTIVKNYFPEIELKIEKAKEE